MGGIELSGNRTRFLYELLQADGSTSRRCTVHVDADSTGLTLAGVVNQAATSVSLTSTLRMIIPPAYTSKKVNVCARAVKVRFTSTLPAGRSTDLAWVVVFRRSVWLSYAVGQAGTFQGLPVECVDKLDGSPSVTGGF